METPSNAMHLEDKDSMDRHFMQLALSLAEKGRGFVSPNPMVGAVVVKDGQVIGQGYHQHAGQSHAEVYAIDDAGVGAHGATLYVTLEPCNHTGKTPPCTQKIIQAGIKRVVAAMADPNPGVKGGGFACLQTHGISLTAGTCEDEARKLNEAFVTFVTTGRPFVIYKCAATLDGQIATRTGDSKWVTGTEARRFVHMLRHSVDAIMVGIGTVITDNPSLTTRLEKTAGKDPRRIILDTRLTMPETAKVLSVDSPAETIIVVGKPAPAEKRARIQAKGARVLVLPCKHGQIDLAALMDWMGAAGITSLLVEGGSRVAASAVAAGIINKAVMFYAPKFSGGNDGVPICRGSGAQLMRDSLPLHDIEVRQFGDDVMIAGYFR
jgi:diaminohydroxyphosphoribosylaminopyrimidine deaminase/5-amino-6-(5-phosphoribosylamino)uracil reductase